MALKRLPLRDPRTVARDIPGVLDVLFPRLAGGLVSRLNKDMFSFSGLTSVPDEAIEKSNLQKAMLFELAMVRAEKILVDGNEPSWQECLEIAAERQSRHYDAVVPDKLEQCDLDVASHTAHNLVVMLNSVKKQNPSKQLERSPIIPGFGWIASGTGDFSIGSTLIEVKNTDRNFIGSDFKQVLMYWMLKYAKAIEDRAEVWSSFLLLNPRRNAALLVSFDRLLRFASSDSNRIELLELLGMLVGQEWDNR